MNFRTASILSAAVAAILAAANAQAGAVMTRHMREEVNQSEPPNPMASMAADQSMSLDLVLPLSDPAGLESFLADIYNPCQPQLPSLPDGAEFTAKFGPTQEDYDSVVAYANANGLTVTGGSRDGMEVQVKGPVAAVEKAFHVKMLTYPRSSGNGTFFAPDREPTTDLSFNLWHVSGTRQLFHPAPDAPQRSEWAAEHGVTCRSRW
jgi:subtilase family serine protease